MPVHEIYNERMYYITDIDRLVYVYEYIGITLAEMSDDRIVYNLWIEPNFKKAGWILIGEL